jgi:hypothetical protein
MSETPQELENRRKHPGYRTPALAFDKNRPPQTRTSDSQG